MGRSDEDLARVLGRDAVFLDKKRLHGGQEWPAELTLERVSDEGRRFDGLIALLGLQTLTPEARHRVTAIALGLERTTANDGRSVERLDWLGAVADDAHLARILELILHSDGVTAVPEAIAAILPRMQETEFDAILDAAGTLPAEHLAYAPRHRLLATLAPRLPERPSD